MTAQETAARRQTLDPSPAITFRGVSKTYGAHTAVQSLDLQINEGEFFCLLGPSGCGTIDVEEASSALTKFEDGALGVFETAKVCPGRPCGFTFELNGSLGTLRFEYPRLNELWYGSTDAPPELYGMLRIRAEHPAQPETAGWWPIGQGIGYGASFVNQAAELLQQWPNGPWAPDLMTGLKVQAVCEAIERASAERRWVEVSEVAARAAV